jgi:hypothetical protein
MFKRSNFNLENNIFYELFFKLFENSLDKNLNKENFTKDFE